MVAPILVLLAIGRFRCAMDLVVTPRGGGVAVGLYEGLSKDIEGESVVGGESRLVAFG